MQHPLEKKVMSSHTYKNQIFFLVHEWRISPETHLVIVLAPTSFFHTEATCKSSTINELLYAHETLTVARRCDVPRDWLWDACHVAGVHWGSRCEGFCSKEGPHYHFEQSARNRTINIIHKFGNPLGIPSRAVLRSLVGLMSHKEVLVQGFLWVRKVWFAFAQLTFATETFGKRWKASFFEKPMCSVPEIWWRMYNVLPRSAKGTRNGTRNWIPVQPRKAQSN